MCLLRMGSRTSTQRRTPREVRHGNSMKSNLIEIINFFHELIASMNAVNGIFFEVGVEIK